MKKILVRDETKHALLCGCTKAILFFNFLYLSEPLSLLLTSCQLGLRVGGAGEHGRRRGGVGGDGLFVLGEKCLPVSLLLLFPCMLRPGMEL
jgi:hypothetical protein